MLPFTTSPSSLLSGESEKLPSEETILFGGSGGGAGFVFEVFL